MRRLRRAASRPASSCRTPLSSRRGRAAAGRARDGPALRCAGCEGDYPEDEWGFDEEFAELVEPFFELPLRPLVARPGRGRPQRAGARARAAGRQPRRHPAVGRDDDRHGAAARAPAAAPPALPGAQLGVRPALDLDLRAQGRRGGGLALQRASAARAGRARGRLPGGREGHGQAVRRALPRCSASAAAASSRSRCGPGRRSCRWRWWAARRSTRSSASSPPWPAPSARRTSRSRPTFPWLGPLGAVPLPSKWRIEFCEPIETASHGVEAAGDRATVLELTERVRDTVQQALYASLVRRGRAFV